MEISDSYRRHVVSTSDHVYSSLELDREDSQEPQPGSSCDLSFEYSNQDDDDPYEYDEDIPKPSEDNYEVENTITSTKEDNTQQSSSGSSTSGVTPCWGCKGCSSTPLFLLGSPADAPCTCISCQ